MVRALVGPPETIKVDGIVTPLRLKQREDDQFDLVVGQRRYRAARIAGLKKAPYAPSTGNHGPRR